MSVRVRRFVGSDAISRMGADGFSLSWVMSSRRIVWVCVTVSVCSFFCLRRFMVRMFVWIVESLFVVARVSVAFWSGCIVRAYFWSSVICCFVVDYWVHTCWIVFFRVHFFVSIFKWAVLVVVVVLFCSVL